MDRRVLLAGVGGLAAWTALRPSASVSAADRTPIVLWHAMTGANGEEVERLTRDFNASQSEVELEAVFKGSYPETLTAAIAAWRAGKAPHIVQIFEVGTGTMLRRARRQAGLAARARRPGSPSIPRPTSPACAATTACRTAARLDAVQLLAPRCMWYNRDAFEKAGLDPDKPPATWRRLSPRRPARLDVEGGHADRRARRPGSPGSSSSNTPRCTTCLRHQDDGFEGSDAELLDQQPSPSSSSSSASSTWRRTAPSNTPAATTRPTRCSIPARPRSASARPAAAPTSSRTPSSAGPRPAAVRSGGQPAAEQLDHRRRQPVDDDGAEPHAGRVQGRGGVLAFIWRSRSRCAV